MIQVKELKNGKRSITTTRWDDIRAYKMSIADAKSSDRNGTSRKWRKTALRDLSKEELAVAVETLKLAKQGVWEINQYVSKLKDSQLENYKINYGPLEEYESYDDMVEKRNKLETKLFKEEEDLKEIERLNHEIMLIDNFCEKELEASRNRSPESERMLNSVTSKNTY